MRQEYAIHLPRDSPEIRRYLGSLGHILELNPEKETLIIDSQRPPSDILQSLRHSGFPAVFRGLGIGTQIAAVALLEHFKGMNHHQWAQYNNRGLARLLQITPDTCMLDLTADQLEPMTHYSVDIHELGDLSSVPESTGMSLCHLGRFQTDAKGRGMFVADVGLRLWEVIGLSLVIQNGKGDVVCGIVARSAGVWENTKRICACSGKTLWDESKL
jgi:copper chaperone for superoxide dismutase